VTVNTVPYRGNYRRGIQLYMMVSECWLKDSELIELAQCVLTLPRSVCQTLSSCNANLKALNHAVTLITPAPTAHQMYDAISLAEFLLPGTFDLCIQLAGFANQRLSDLFVVAVERLHMHKQLSLKTLFLHTDPELGYVRTSAEDIKSVFEKTSQARCRTCAQLLQHSLVLRALCSTVASSASTAQFSWSFLQSHVFKDDIAFSCTALLLYLSSAAASTAFAQQHW
jgi:hypothetical protein